MQPVREVYSLLMPIQDGRIIVPRAAVAEVMGYTRPKERPDDAPEFMLGYIEWQGQKVPLVSYEAARGRGVPELGRRTRIAVVFGIAGRLQPDVFAVVTQGYPYLVRVNENVLQREPMETDDPLVLARVRMANEKPYIPDFAKLEVLLAEGLGLTPAAGVAGTDEAVDELDALSVGGEEEDFDATLLGSDVDTEAGAESDLNEKTGSAPDFGEATAAGEETNYAAELDESSETPEESGETAPDTASIDLDDVTAFGGDTNYSNELEELSGALDSNEGAADVAADAAAVDLDEVTAFGGETNYSAELDELSDALAVDSPEAGDDAGDYEIDLSGLELDEVSAGGKDARQQEEAQDEDSPDDDAYDLSDLEFDVGDDDSK